MIVAISGAKPKVGPPRAMTPPKDVREAAKQEPTDAVIGTAPVQQESGVPPETIKASEGGVTRADTAGDAARDYTDDHVEVITCGDFFKNFLMGKKGRKK